MRQYNHSNQNLTYDLETKSAVLMSYSTVVLVIVNGKILQDEYSKISVTTSKHISQAKGFLMDIGILG